MKIQGVKKYKNKEAREANTVKIWMDMFKTFKKAGGTELVEEVIQDLVEMYAHKVDKVNSLIYE